MSHTAIVAISKQGAALARSLAPALKGGKTLYLERCLSCKHGAISLTAAPTGINRTRAW